MTGQKDNQKKAKKLQIVGCVISREGGGAGYCVRVDGHDCALHLAQLKLILHISTCCYGRREPIFHPTAIAALNGNDVETVKRSVVRKLGREFDRVSGRRWFQAACNGDRLLGVELDQIELDPRLLTHPRQEIQKLAAEAFKAHAAWRASRNPE